jgi:hypothetical protein
MVKQAGSTPERSGTSGTITGNTEPASSFLASALPASSYKGLFSATSFSVEKQKRFSTPKMRNYPTQYLNSVYYTNSTLDDKVRILLLQRYHKLLKSQIDHQHSILPMQ